MTHPLSFFQPLIKKGKEKRELMGHGSELFLRTHHWEEKDGRDIQDLRKIKTLNIKIMLDFFLYQFQIGNEINNLIFFTITKNSQLILNLFLFFYLYVVLKNNKLSTFSLI